MVDVNTAFLGMISALLLLNVLLVLQRDQHAAGHQHHPHSSHSLRGASSLLQQQQQPVSTASGSLPSSSTTPSVWEDFYFDAYVNGFQALQHGPGKAVLRVSSGRLALPASITRVKVDVGAAMAPGEGKKVAAELDSNPNLVIFAFEPTPSSYADALHYVNHPRFILLNAAASPQLGFQQFSLGRADCNSLLPRNPNVTWTHGAQDTNVQSCAHTSGSTNVPAFPLSHLLKRLDATVEFLKTDAQGFDFDVLQSCGPYLATKVHMLQFEAQDVQDSSQLLYVGASTLSKVDGLLVAQGFARVQCEVLNPAISEVNCVYKNTAI